MESDKSGSQVDDILSSNRRNSIVDEAKKSSDLANDDFDILTISREHSTKGVHGDSSTIAK